MASHHLIAIPLTYIPPSKWKFCINSLVKKKADSSGISFQMSSPEEWLVCGLCSAKVMMKNIAGIAKAAQVHNLPEKSSLNASFVCLEDEADSSN